MITSEETLCPLCSGKGQKNHLVAVFYKSREGLYTCEDKTCTYFLTDAEGNLVKFNKDSNTTGYILDRTPKRDVIDEELDHFFDSLGSAYDKDRGNNDNIQIPVSQSYEKELISQKHEIKNEVINATENLKMEDIFKTDCSDLNFEDFL
ncbi:uncharacterized protein LOC135849360 [Planococcus citri]|uniref:uncharacterized protein LOC135849360 n=1 Tax=Planococcus citri TaxID=170843 RepID=UPI0031F8399D